MPSDALLAGLRDLLGPDCGAPMTEAFIYELVADGDLIGATGVGVAPVEDPLSVDRREQPPVGRHERLAEERGGRIRRTRKGNQGIGQRQTKVNWSEASYRVIKKSRKIRPGPKPAPP